MARFEKSAFGLPLAWLLFALALGAFESRASAQAYIDPPPNVLTDENGVNLADGSIHYQLFHALPAIDPALPPFTRHWMDRGWRDTMTMTLTVNYYGSLYTVAIGTASELFTTTNGTTFTSQKNIGSTLAWDAATGHYVYTVSSGAVYRFDPTGFGGFQAYNRVLARVTQIAFPSGATITLTYQTNVTCTGTCVYTTAARLQDVSSSNGFSFHLQYASDATGVGTAQSWLRLTRVTRYNRALEYCGPAANSCSFANPWPSIQYGQTNIPSQYSNEWIETETNSAGETAQLVRLTQNALVSTRRPGSTTDDMSVSSNGEDVTQIVRDGRTWVYNFVQTWACCGNWTMTATVTRPGGGQIQTVAYELSGLPISVRDEFGQTTFYTFNQMNLADIAHPDGRAVHYTYDSRGNQTSRTLVSSTAGTPPDVVTTAAFDPVCYNRVTCNRPNSRTDPNGNATEYTYDPVHGGVLTETMPAPAPGAVRPQTRYQYAQFQGYFRNSEGSIVASGVPTYLQTGSSLCRTLASCAGSADEVRTVVGYGPQSAGTANNLLPVASTISAGDNSLTATTATSYDPNGWQLSVDGPLAGTADTTRYRYDAVGRTIGVAGPDPDGAGSLANRAIRTTYDAAGRPTLVEQGTVAGQSDAAWAAFSSLQQQAIAYDAAGRRAKETRASGGTTFAATQFSYDVAGRPECTVERMNPAVFSALPSSACTLGSSGSYGSDRIVKRLYDLAGQPLQVRSAVGTPDESAVETRTYASNGNLATIADAENNLTSYSYDGLGRLRTTWFPVTARGAGLSSTSDYEQYGYDAAGNRTSLRKRDNSTLTYTYDALNRVTRKTVPERAGLATMHTRDVFYSYDLRGLPLSTRFDSQSGEGVTNVYDAFGRLTSSSINMGVTRALAHQYDVNGNRTRITHPDGLYFTYQYDVLNRLDTALQGANALVDMTYDAQGRVTGRSDGTAGGGGTVALGYDPIGRLASLAHDMSGTSRDLTLGFAYNPAGQIASSTRSNDAFAWTGHYAVNRPYTTDGLNRYTAAGPATFTYDLNGNLASDGATTFTYDVENRLVAASGTRNGTLVYDPLGRVFQYAGAGAATLTFLYDGDALVAEYDGAGTRLRAYAHGADAGADDPIVWYEGSQRRFLRADHQGSIVQTAGSTGTPFDTLTYDEYGIPGAANAGRFQYTGQIWLAELGLYHYKARVYSPTLGRFMQTDPVGYDGGINLYAYVGNDPLNHTDPSGMCIGPLIIPCAIGGAELIGPGLVIFFGVPMAMSGPPERPDIPASDRSVSRNDNGGPPIERRQVAVAQRDRLQEARRLETGAARKLANAAKHDRRATEFARNPTVRPGMEGRNFAEIANQQRDRIAHLRREAAEFRRQAAADLARARRLREGGD